MGKKDSRKMAKERERFIAGARRQNVAEREAEEIFQQMETFAAYGFNKSHSAAYALISYQTAYLKAHYPEEFMAGLMTLEMGDTDKTYKNIAECRERRIAVLPPDVNESHADFTVVRLPDGKRAIRFGLGAVRGIGSKAVEAIVAAREAGPFRDLGDFAKRVNSQHVNKRVLESLVKCGGFDFTGEPRCRMLAGLDVILRWANQANRPEDANQMGLFAGLPQAVTVQQPPALPEVPEWTKTELLRAEREVLGFFITGHPLDKYQRDLRRFTDASVADLKERGNQEKIRVGGVVHTLKLKNSKRGDRYGTFVLEDKTGVIEVIAWPETYRRCETAIHGEDPIVVSATLEVGEERCQLIADEVVPLAAAREKTVRQVHFALAADVITESHLYQLRDKLAQHPGSCPTFLHLLLSDRTETVIALPSSLRVAASERLIEDVDGVLGGGVVSFR